MAEVFRFVSLRGPAPLLDATKPLVVHVPVHTQQAAGTLSPALEKISLHMAGVRYLVSDNSLLKLLDVHLDFTSSQNRDEPDFFEMLTALRRTAEYLYTRAAQGKGAATPGAGDAAAVQILTIEYIERVLKSLNKGTGSTEEQAARCRDFFLRSVLSVDLGARPAMTLPTAPPKETGTRRPTPAPAPPTATHKRELRLLRVAVDKLVRNISAGGSHLMAELMTADELAGFKLVPGMHALTGELAMVDAEIQQATLEKAEEKIRDRVAEMAALGDLSEGQPMPRAPAAKPTTTGTTGTSAGKKETAPLRLGIGDLLMTELVSSGYAYGDIAHIENIMSGELRERSFRKSSSTETDVFQMTETEATTETDTQSTQRFELEKASEATLNEALNLDAGASISGSYGPVTAQASFGLASTTSREQSQKQSSKFAQEVVSKATQKVRQLSSRQERVITKVVVEDNTLHSMSNPTGSDHISGIYRWVDKVDDLRLVDYGQRLMVGLTVPEPASYLRWLAARGNGGAGALPQPTVVRGGVPTGLRPDDITPDNYLTWLAAYNATDIEPPPARFVTQSLTLHSDPSESAERPGVVTKADSTIVVPPGYRAVQARGSAITHELPGISDTIPEVLLGIGSTAIPINATAASDVVRVFSSALPSLPGSTADRKEGGAGTKLPVVLSIGSMRGYALAVEVVFERSDTLLEAWRIDSWAKIMNAYKAAVSEAEAQAARATLPGVNITGANPRENRTLERAELKRQVMELMAAAIGSVDAVVDAADARPRADAAKVASLETLMSYLDRAFEWEHMSWVLQDYFWAPETSWSALLGSTDSDPLRQLFLRSGAASITLPVRRGFEAAVLYRVWTGLDWQGDRAPLPADPAALALGAEVVTSATGVPQQGREVTGSRWKERNPTSLVILQPDGLLSWVDEA